MNLENQNQIENNLPKDSLESDLSLMETVDSLSQEEITGLLDLLDKQPNSDLRISSKNLDSILKVSRTNHLIAPIEVEFGEKVYILDKDGEFLEEIQNAKDISKITRDISKRAAIIVPQNTEEIGIDKNALQPVEDKQVAQDLAKNLKDIISPTN